MRGYLIRLSRIHMSEDKYDCQLIVGSIRKPSDVDEAIEAGADIMTIPYKIKEFDEAWKKFNELRVPSPAP